MGVKWSNEVRKIIPDAKQFLEASLGTVMFKVFLKSNREISRYQIERLHKIFGCNATVEYRAEPQSSSEFLDQSERLTCIQFVIKNAEY